MMTELLFSISFVNVEIVAECKCFVVLLVILFHCSRGVQQQLIHKYQKASNQTFQQLSPMDSQSPMLVFLQCSLIGRWMDLALTLKKTGSFRSCHCWKVLELFSASFILIGVQYFITVLCKLSYLTSFRCLLNVFHHQLYMLRKRSADNKFVYLCRQPCSLL